MAKRNNNKKNTAKKEIVNNEVSEKVVEELADIEEANAKNEPVAEVSSADIGADLDNIIILTDENGAELEFEIIDDYEMNGTRYFAMFPPEDIGDEDSDIIEYVILKLAKDEDGNDCFVSVDDPDELDDVADYFDDRFSAEIDYDEN